MVDSIDHLAGHWPSWQRTILIRREKQWQPPSSEEHVGLCSCETTKKPRTIVLVVDTQTAESWGHQNQRTLNAFGTRWRQWCGNMGGRGCDKRASWPALCFAGSRGRTKVWFRPLRCVRNSVAGHVQVLFQCSSNVPVTDPRTPLSGNLSKLPTTDPGAIQTKLKQSTGAFTGRDRHSAEQKLSGVGGGGPR